MILDLIRVEDKSARKLRSDFEMQLFGLFFGVAIVLFTI